MSSAASDAHRAELMAQLAEIKDPLEGFEDYDRVDIKDASKPPNQQQLDDYAQRKDLIHAVLSAMDALDADGYPVLTTLEVPDEIYDDLERQSTTILAALARYRRKTEPQSVEVSDGELVPKDRLMEGAPRKR